MNQAEAREQVMREHLLRRRETAKLVGRYEHAGELYPVVARIERPDPGSITWRLVVDAVVSPPGGFSYPSEVRLAQLGHDREVCLAVYERLRDVSDIPERGNYFDAGAAMFRRFFLGEEAQS